MTNAASILFGLGAILLGGLAIDAVGRHTPLPRVSLLLVFGLLIGPSNMHVLPQAFVDSFDLMADMALLMVGFLLGGQFTIKALREHGREILWISITAVIVTAVVVFAVLVPLGIGIELALILAGIAPATAPAATVDVVHEVRAEGPFTSSLLGIVAVDDAWGLLLFSLCSAVAAALLGVGNVHVPLKVAAWEVGGAIVLGVLLGLPVAQLTGRIEPGEPTLTEALGVVFLCGGLALWMEVSFLIASMVLGAVVVNFATHHTRPFHAIEHIEWPFMILFFVVAGATLEFATLKHLGFITGAYIAARALGRLLGGWVGAVMCRATQPVRRWIGMALMPQAGVALGMALVASSRIPPFEEILLPVVISSTVVFELAGPVLTRYALYRVGEAPSRNTGAT